MNIRGKLNFAFVNSSVAGAVIAVVLTQSAIVFIVLVFVGLLLSLFLGNIRPSPRHRPH